MNAFLMLIIIVGVSVQQVAKKAYNKKVKNGTFSFSAASAFIAVSVFIITSDGSFDFTAGILKYSVLFAASYSMASVSSLLAISTGSLSLTSLIIQYSLVIPTFYGLFVLNEPIKLSMVIGVILLLVSLVLINLAGKGEKHTINLKWGIFALLAFVGNGACSTIQKVQQMEFPGLYKSEFMIIAYIITVAILMILAVFSEKKEIVPHLKKGAGWYIVCGLANGIVNYLVLVMSLRMPASVMFPLISAGGIVMTALISVFVYKEKLSLQQKMGLMLGLMAIVVLNM